MASARLPGALQGLRHREMTAESNGIAYGVWTWTPAGYEESDQPHPLLIVLDGEMMCGGAVLGANAQHSLLRFARENSPMSAADDRFSIIATLDRYAECLDTRDWDGLKDMFTSDTDVDFGPRRGSP